MQPQAAPATNCATISVLRLPAISATAPSRPVGQCAAMLDDDACRKHRDVEADLEHRHQPLQISGLGEAQIERRAVDAEMQLIAK
jgi:hypothetical protein